MNKLAKFRAVFHPTGCFRYRAVIINARPRTGDSLSEKTLLQQPLKEERQMGVGYEFLNDNMSYLQMCKLRARDYSAVSVSGANRITETANLVL